MSLDVEKPDGIYDPAGNQFDPDKPLPADRKKTPLVAKVYGVLCLIDGIITVPVALLFMGLVIWAVFERPDLVAVGDITLTTIVSVLSFIVIVVNAVCLVAFGIMLLRNRRRHAARWSYLLIVLTIVRILLDIMLQGLGEHLIAPAVQLVILLALSVTMDPSLREERALQRRLRSMQDREAAEDGTLGRDPEGKGYIELNFFNLFWVFVVCCVLGLLIETVYHMVVVDPGHYQDRAGMLFGPFSPIYGFGAVLMTVALNRFYRSNPIIIFVVSAVIGGAFEFFVSWFMQTAFGAVAWDYSGMKLFGVPDPIAAIAQGRTSTPFMLMWGALGFAWIKLCLPYLLKLINIIPWKVRYSFTTLCAVLMLVNGVMTLQALDCWFERVSGIQATSPVEQFYAEHFDNAYMEHRFQSMSITPDDTSRVDGSGAGDAAGDADAGADAGSSSAASSAGSSASSSASAQG